MTLAPSPFAARVLVEALAAAGVRDVVVAPGSRSAPLVYALADAAREGAPAGLSGVEVHVRLDERDAAFCALGIAKGAAALGEVRPVAVVTTSGTAVGNLLPAVLEAHHSGVALLLLTADRPLAMRGAGANQTTHQPGLLEPAVRATVDLAVDEAPGDPQALAEVVRAVAREVVTTALGADPGPVHLNIAFPEPLVPGREMGEELQAVTSAGPETAVAASAGSQPALATGAGSQPAVAKGAGARVAGARPDLRGTAQREAGVALLRPGPATVVVAGDGAGEEARSLAEARGWPLLAEPGSGARGGPAAVPAYRLLLDGPWGREVRRAVVVGRPTLSRPVARLLARGDVEVLRVQRPSAAWPRAGEDADVLLDELPPDWLAGPRDDEAWLARWLDAGRAALDVVRELWASGDPVGRAPARMSGPELADLVARATGPDHVLVLGSSNPVRDLDLVADWDVPPVVVTNRGLSGIDGMLATAGGVALAVPDRVVRALVGDLTFLHDVGGLLTGPLERPPHLQVVVANDDGGSVFATLEHGEPERANVFERFFATPHGADLSALCAGYGVRHRLAREVAEVAEALASPGPGVSVLEVRIDRSRRRELDRTTAREVAARLAGE